jgi:superfamily II DNA/RNA helicase
MFYEDENFIIGAVAGFIVGMLIMWLYRNWKDSRKPDLDAQIIRMRDKQISDLMEEKKGDAIIILNLTADIETMKQINPLIEQQINSLNLWKQKNKEEKEEFQELQKQTQKARIEKNQALDEVKRAKDKAKDKEQNKEKEQDTDLDDLNKKSKGLSTTKPKQ